MSTIFVSYRRDDSSGHAGRLYDRLADRFGKDKLFRDIDHISYGEDFVEALDEAVGSCKALIAVIGPTWLTAKDKRGRRRLDNSHDFVRIEIESALSRGIPIFPVLVNNGEMPDIDELPESISGLARRQALEISETRVDYDVGQLIKVLEAKVGPALKPVDTGRLADTAHAAVTPIEKPTTREPEKTERSEEHYTTKLVKELENEPLPPSVKTKLSTLKESIQLRFLDFYRQHKRSVRIAYLFLLLPLPMLGLHNLYLGNRARLFAFWLVSGVFFVGMLLGIENNDGKMVVFTITCMIVWPVIDLFLLPSMVGKRNEFIAQEIVFGEVDDKKK
jgi:hypothetical protein